MLRQWLSVRCGSFCRKDTALAAAAMYQAMFGDEDGSIPATYQVRCSLAPYRHRPTAKYPCDCQI